MLLGAPRASRLALHPSRSCRRQPRRVERCRRCQGRSSSSRLRSDTPCWQIWLEDGVAGRICLLRMRCDGPRCQGTAAKNNERTPPHPSPRRFVRGHRTGSDAEADSRRRRMNDASWPASKGALQLIVVSDLQRRHPNAELSSLGFGSGTPERLRCARRRVGVVRAPGLMRCIDHVCALCIVERSLRCPLRAPLQDANL